MAINVGISEDEEFLVTFPGANNSFTALLGIMRKYGGKFNHNKRTLIGDNFSKVWVFDSHLAKIICEEIKCIDPRFLIPSWANEINSTQDKDFVKFRATIDPTCVKSEWAGDYQRKGVLRGISQNRLALYWEMGCVAEGSLVFFDGHEHPIEVLYRRFHSNRKNKKRVRRIRQLKEHDHNVFGLGEVLDVLFSGVKDCFRVTLENGKSVELTWDHEILTERGYIPVSDLIIGQDKAASNGRSLKCKVCGGNNMVSTKGDFPGLCISCRNKEHNKMRFENGPYIRKRISKKDGYIRLSGRFLRDWKFGSDANGSYVLEHDYIMLNHIQRPFYQGECVHHINKDKTDNRLENLILTTASSHMKEHIESCVSRISKDHISSNGRTTVVIVPNYSKIVSIIPVGKKKTYDIKMFGPSHNFLANKIVVHNCGKSFAIQTILNHLVRWERVNKYIILSPPEGVINIALECIRFSSFNLTWNDIYIVDTTHRNPFDYPEKKVIIMTYRNLIMLHDDEYKKQKGKRGSPVIRRNYIPWEKLGDKLCMIADEAHNVKNSRSKTWHILDKAKSFFEYRYIMTGTPAPKYAADLWTQMRFLHEKSVASDYYSFLRSIANLGNRFSAYAINFYYEDRVKNFLDSVEYLISREKTAGNLELPPVVYNPIRIQMPPKQERLYQAIANLVITTIKKDEDGRVSLNKLRNKFSYLSLALHDPCIIQEGKIEESETSPIITSILRNWEITENGKYEVAKSLIEKYADEDRKIILWSGHPKIIDTLTEKFKDFNPYKLHGGVVVNKGESVSERNAAICNAFVQDIKSNLLIANYDCLSSAVNLVEVTRMIFWDRSWDFSTYIQALKRANRIGSTEPLIVNILILFSSIEEYQNTEIEKRLEFNDDLWNSGKNAERVLDNRDILSLSDCQHILAGKVSPI
jgi:hypothetical protein